jgi:motility quorum-sensing regulator/GCU-specific mRNA interferase toxin
MGMGVDSVSVNNLLAKYGQSDYYSRMEKSAPHNKLSVIKGLIKSGRVRATKSAREGATALGINFDGMLAVVTSLTMSDFYKSMTTHVDHKVWQDVYRPTANVGEVYLKLTIADDLLIVSFKEL